jgi:hypothetical protein
MNNTGLAIIALLLCLFSYIRTSTAIDEINKEEYKKEIKEVKKELDEINLKLLTPKNLLEELKYQKVQHPEIVLRQSILESGWFKCTSCSMRYNNPFGFRHKSWIDDANPRGYLKFDMWQDAVKYYKKWQKKRYKGGDYYKFLVDIGYAQDTTYISKLKSLNI